MGNTVEMAGGDLHPPNHHLHRSICSPYFTAILYQFYLWNFSSPLLVLELLPINWLDMLWMVIQSTSPPPTLLEQPWSHAGQQHQLLQPTCQTLPMILLPTLLELATSTKLMVIPSLMEPMVMLLSQPTTTHHIIMLEPVKQPSVGSLVKIFFSQRLKYNLAQK